MRYVFHVTLHTRPADKGETQSRQVVIYRDSRSEAVKEFWKAINRGGFGVGLIDEPAPRPSSGKGASRG